MQIGSLEYGTSRLNEGNNLKSEMTFAKEMANNYIIIHTYNDTYISYNNTYEHYKDHCWCVHENWKGVLCNVKKSITTLMLSKII